MAMKDLSMHLRNVRHTNVAYAVTHETSSSDSVSYMSYTAEKMYQNMKTCSCWIAKNI